MEREVKMVVVGDQAMGKTCLVWAYAKHEIPPDYVPSVVEHYVVKRQWADTEITLQLWDTAGAGDLENVRVLSYTNTDVFLICCSLRDPGSWFNLEVNWIPEITRYVRKPRFILVGTKKDLRNHDAVRLDLALQGLRMIDSAEGEAKANEIGASGYVECSALDSEGVEEVFNCALRVALNPRQEKKKRCNVA
jgi:small GTP-binding protein